MSCFINAMNLDTLSSEISLDSTPAGQVHFQGNTETLQQELSNIRAQIRNAPLTCGIREGEVVIKCKAIPGHREPLNHRVDSKGKINQLVCYSRNECGMCGINNLIMCNTEHNTDLVPIESPIAEEEA